MAESRDSYLEITLRLLPGTLGELLRQLGTAMGGGTAAPAAETAVPIGAEESGSFEEERFEQLRRQEAQAPATGADVVQTMAAQPPRRRERTAWEAVSLPQRQEREPEGARYAWKETVPAAPAEQERQTGEAAAPEGPVHLQMETVRREAGAAAAETADAERLSAVYERDARRYDGAFPLY